MKDCVNIILYDKKKKILIQHRDNNAPTSPNHWGFFGGAIEKNETPEQAVIRETFEELNIKLKKPKLFLKEYVDKKGKEHNTYFFIEKIKDKSKIELKEGQGMRWIFPNEIDSLLAKPYVKRIAKTIKTNYLN